MRGAGAWLGRVPPMSGSPPSSLEHSLDVLKQSCRFGPLQLILDEQNLLLRSRFFFADEVGEFLLDLMNPLLDGLHGGSGHRPGGFKQ